MIRRLLTRAGIIKPEPGLWRPSPGEENPFGNLPSSWIEELHRRYVANRLPALAEHATAVLESRHGH